MLQQQQFGRLLEPGLRKIFMETYKELPEQYSQVFNVQDSKKAIETDLRMGGFGMWEKKDSAGMVKYQDVPDTAALQYIHEEYASGFTVERKLVDDEQYGQIGKMAKALGRGARATLETKAAAVLNTGILGGTGNNTPVNGFDGTPLVSSAHKRLDGGTLSNILATGDGAGAANGALSDRNLKAAIIQMQQGKWMTRVSLSKFNLRFWLFHVHPYSSLLIQLHNLNSMSSVNGDGFCGSYFTNDKNAITKPDE
jgi:phage major head subunit gpT-like protein